MKKILLFLLTVLFCIQADAQTVTIGSGTGSNTNTSYPAPYGNYFWGARNQLMYTASELLAAGITPGSTFTSLGFNVTGTPTGTTLTNYEMKIGGTTDTVLTNTWLTGLTTCFGPSNYLPTAGVNMHTLSSPYVWNGSDNVVLETCFNNSGWTNNELMEWTTGLPGNYGHTYRNDAAGVCGNTATSFLVASRTNLTITYTPGGGCVLPTNLMDSAVTTTTADLYWTDLNTTAPLFYDIEVVPAGGTPTGVPTHTPATLPYTVTSLSPATSYDYYVRAHCSATDTSMWNGPHTFTTLATCVVPSALTATNITSSGADLSWTSTDTLFDLEIGLSGFTPTGTPVIPGIPNNFSLSGLPDNTCFDYYVRAVCGGANGNSNWVGPYTFCTSIAPLACPGTSNASILFTEEFANTNTGDGVNITSSNLPGWVTNLVTGNPRFTLTSTTSGSAATGPSAGAQGSTGFALMEVSCVSGGTDSLISPSIDLSGVVGAARVKWFNHMYGVNSGKLELFIDNGTTLTSVWVDSGQTQNSSTAPWDSAVVNLNAYAGQVINLVFVGTAANPGGCSGDRGIDQIEVEGCVACAAPSNLVASNITSSAADLTWTENGSATAWDIYTVPTGGAAPGGTTTPTIAGVTTGGTATPYNLTGLTLYQSIDVYVRAACSPTELSSWTGPISVLPCAPLAGTYTIDPASAASATNFQTLGDAAFALQCGISAPVVFDMAAGNVFNEQVIFPEVTGASATNTITFNGNGDTVTYAATVSAERHTIRLEGADHFKFNDMVVEATGTSFGFAMHLYNSANGTDSNMFTNCTFQVPITATSTAICPFAVSGSLTSPTTACTAKTNGNIVDSCVARGGYYGMTNYGSFTAADYGDGNQIKNTEVVDFYAYGIYYLYQDNFLASNNNIHRDARTNSTTFYGIYSSGSANGNVIERNWVHNPFPFASSSAFYGIENFAFGAAANATVIKNNLIEDVVSNGAQYAIYQSFADYTSTWHNTIVLDDATSSGGVTRGIWINSGIGQDVQNNNIYITRAGSGDHHGIYNSASPVTCDYNNVYVAPAATHYFGFNGSNQVDLTAWQASSPTVGANSYDVDPIFTATAPDYSPSNPALNTTASTGLGVTVDFTGAARAAMPDIGAFEFNVAATDMSTTALLSPDPAVGCYTANDTIKVEVTNFGALAIDFSVNPMIVGANVTGTITASASDTVNTGTLAPLATLSVTLSPTVNMTANGPYAISAFATTVSDANTSNDTLALVNYNVNLVAGTISATPDVICASGTTDVTLSGNAGGLIQWQTSPTGTAPWTNVGSGMNPHTSAVLTANTFYRAMLTCNSAMDSTNVDTIVVNNPLIATTMGDTVCGADSVTLVATTADTSHFVNWYATATSTSPLAAGTDSLTTYITATDTFYAAAVAGGLGTPALITEVCQFTTSAYVNPGPPFPTNMDDPIEITNISTSALDLGGWSLQVVGSASGVYTIPSGNVVPPGGAIVLDRGPGSADIAGVYLNATILPSTSSSVANGYILRDPSGMIMDVTAANNYNPVGQGSPNQVTAADWTGTTGSSGGTGGIRRTNVDDTNDGSDWTIATGANTTNYGTANVAFTPGGGCEGTRTAVVAISNTAPAITASADQTVCWDSSITKPMTVTSANTAYTYSWAPATGLDMATGDSVNASPLTPTQYIVTATDLGLGCAITDTVNVDVVEQFYDTASADIMTICGTGSVNLMAGDSIPQIPYCTSGASIAADTKIDTVSFAGVTVGSSPTSPESYTDNTATVIPAAAGVALPLSIVNGSSSNVYYGGTVTVYIDYDHSFTFDASELVYTFTTTGLNTIPPTTVTIPTTALNGQTRMRVVLPESDPSVACWTGFYGETEDYTVDISGATPVVTPTYTYTWTPGSLTGPTQTVSPTISTVYTVTQTDANGCTAQDSVSIGVFPVPNVTATITPSTSCVNTTAIPTGGGADTYTWTGGLMDTTAFVVTSNATYTVTGTDANGCTATSAASVTATPASNSLAQAAANNTASTPGSANQTQSHPDGSMVSYYDASCNIIATVDDGAGGNILGNTVSNVTVDATVQTYNGQPYVQRWYDITPTNNGPATVTLYYTQADMDAYNLVASASTWPLLPVDSADAAGIANIRITHISGGALGVGTVSGVDTPTTVWNTADQRWELTFPVSGFSQFFLHAANPNNAALSVSLTDFTVVKNGSVSDASWTTLQEENNSHFNVQRSADGRTFENLGMLNTKAANGNSSAALNYAFTDIAPQIGHNYYRLEQVDQDGTKAYSKIIDLVWGADGSVVSIYPNPATDKLNIDVATDKVTQLEVRLLDMSGRVVTSAVQKTAKGMNNITLNLSEIATGVYGVQVLQNNTLIHTSKVNKGVK